MTHLLRIDASARHTRSLTRALADQFVATWLVQQPDATITVRDVGHNPPQAISEEWIAAVFSNLPLTAEQAAITALSDRLISEVERADLILLAAPMYNYGMPASLKAWFDQVVRIDRTFTFDLARGDRPLEPILSGKTLVVLTSTGEFGFAPGGINEGNNHLLPHIRTCSKYLGAERIFHVGIEYQEFGDTRHARSKEIAEESISKLVDRLTADRVGRGCLPMGITNERRSSSSRY